MSPRRSKVPLAVSTGLIGLVAAFFPQTASAAPPTTSCDGVTDETFPQVGVYYEESRKALDRGEFANAVALAEEALRFALCGVGPDEPAVANFHFNLGVVYHEVGRATDARPQFERSIELYSIKPGAAAIETINAWRSLGEVFLTLQDYASARQAFDTAVRGYEAIGSSSGDKLPAALRMRGEARLALGDAAGGTADFDRAIALFEAQYGREALQVAVALGQYALAMQNAGALQRAKELHVRSNELRERLGDDKLTATGYNNLAEVHRELGEYRDAETLLRKALAIHERLGNAADVKGFVSVLNNLARTFLEKGDGATAKPFAERALVMSKERLGELHPLTTIARSHLANIALLQNDWIAAIQGLQEVLAIAERIYPPTHPQIANYVNNLAVMHLRIFDYERARPLLQRSLKIVEDTWGPEHPEVAAKLMNLSDVEMIAGRPDEASRYARRALEIAEKSYGPDHPIAAVALLQLGVTSLRSNRIDDALGYFQRNQDGRERAITTILAGGTEAQKKQFLLATAKELDIIVSVQQKFAPDRGDARRMAATTVLRRKGRVLDAASDDLRQLRATLDVEGQRLLDELARQRATLAKLTVSGGRGLDTQAFHDEVTSVRASVTSLEQALADRSSAFRARSAPVTLEAVQAAIPEDAVLIEFVAYAVMNPTDLLNTFSEKRYAAYVIRRTGEVTAVDLGLAGPIDEAVAALRRELVTPRSVNAEAKAEALHGLLFAKIRPLLRKDDHLIVSPDGQLNVVPFAVLRSKHRWLLEDHEITYVSSGRDLLRIGSEPAPRSQAFVLGDPAYDDTAGGGAASGTRSADLASARFNPLPGTGEEVASLRKLLDDPDVVTQADATEARLKALVGPEIVHVATHGFFLPADRGGEAAEKAARALVFDSGIEEVGAARVEDPLLRAGLALAGANRRQSGDEDGILTALEAASIDLVGTQLVVMSACETGLGDVENGEGVYGLRRALVLAGAQTQVMSLWKVDDAATRDLMVDFYARLTKKKKGCGESLRAAQLALAKDKATKHPYYWAAFVASGDWRPIVKATARRELDGGGGSARPRRERPRRGGGGGGGGSSKFAQWFKASLRKDQPILLFGFGIGRPMPGFDYEGESVKGLHGWNLSFDFTQRRRVMLGAGYGVNVFEVPTHPTNPHVRVSRADLRVDIDLLALPWQMRVRPALLAFAHGGLAFGRDLVADPTTGLRPNERRVGVGVDLGADLALHFVLKKVVIGLRGGVAKPFVGFWDSGDPLSYLPAASVLRWNVALQVGGPVK